MTIYSKKDDRLRDGIVEKVCLVEKKNNSSSLSVSGLDVFARCNEVKLKTKTTYGERKRA